MCGRYVNVASTSDLTSEFEIEETLGEDLPSSWNIAPTDPVRIVTLRRPRDGDDAAEPARQLRTARWGLVPHWSKTRKPNLSMINARVETITGKPAFKAAAARRRAIVPALGYYEWQTTGHGKIAHFLHDDNDNPLAFAGLYEIWRDPDLPDEHPDAWLWTTTIITRPAADALGHIHDRCPVIVPPELYQGWLDCSSGEPATARDLLEQMPEPHLEPRVVSRAVGNVRNNGPDLIEPVLEPRDQPQQLQL